MSADKNKKRTGRHRVQAGGFTLIELLVVVAIIGIIAAVAVVVFTETIVKARVSSIAADLKAFETGFLTYASDHGHLPPDSHLEAPYHLPPGAGMEDYLSAYRWSRGTPLGGDYNWEGPDNYPYAGISLYGTPAPVSTLALLDEKIDDGNLGQGRFRITPNNRYTFIIAE
jgi:prepilin-type N-terminal cleavage/methylation domain-containing protein